MSEEQNCSLKDMKLISVDILEDRLTTVKDLLQSERVYYGVSKDKVTGEHFLHYSFLTIDGLSQKVLDQSHRLLPLESDDVLAVIFGEPKDYAYPEQWKSSFLRNGPGESYVWFDPSLVEEAQVDEERAQKAVEKLSSFKKEGNFDDEAMRKLLKEIDSMWD
jgi:hypothetical protein